MTEISATSPATLLAKSLTDAETRGEWVVERGARTPLGFVGNAVEYINKARDITITDGWCTAGLSMHDLFRTPFTLTDAEKDVVRKAIATFNKHLSDERERAALARLVAPKRKAAAK